MNNQKKVKTTRELWFYIALGICLVALILSATLYFSIKDSKTNNLGDLVTDIPTTEDPVVTPDEPEAPTVSQILFIMPVNGSVLKEYSEVPVFNSTFNRYSAHMALDFSASAGSPVYAVLDGEVVDVTTSITKGVTVKIDHGNGLVTVYNSLEDALDVEVGTLVKTGDVIGRVGTTNRQEYSDGAHLHFEVYENNEVINPEKYLTLDEK